MYRTERRSSRRRPPPGGGRHRLYRLTGGTIDQVGIDVGGEAYLDLEREAEPMLIRE
jgi:hypothetical protein